MSHTPPNVIARIFKLQQQGLSIRKIHKQLSEEGVTVSHMLVQRTLASHKENPLKSKTDNKENLNSREPLLPELPDLPEHASLAARMVYQELIEVRGVARTFYQRVEDGDAPLNAWTQAKQHVLRLIKQLEEMVPAPPADPSKDPMAIACRDMTHGQILQAVRVAQAQLGHLCPACRNETMAAHG